MNTETMKPDFSGVIVRLLAPEDAVAFQALRLRGLQEWPSAFASSFEEEVDTAIDVVASRLAPREDAAVLGVFENEHLVAIAGIARESMKKLAHKAYIWGVYVAPEARGRGIGQRLMQAVLEHAGNVLRVRQVNLGVNAANQTALALYQRMGFEAFGLERGFMLLDGVLQDEIQMARRLDDLVQRS
jgi:ribosomal protein S18 acetylase RimI-like enzyme